MNNGRPSTPPSTPPAGAEVSAAPGLHPDRVVNPPAPEEVICYHCNHILVSPLEGACQHALCSPCAFAVLGKGGVCPAPNCGTVLTRLGLTGAHRIVRKKLDELVVTCDHASDGCNAEVPLGSMKAHLELTCLAAVIPCPIDAAACPVQLQRRNLKTHRDTCQYRSVLCELCGDSTRANKLEVHRGEMDRHMLTSATQHNVLIFNKLLVSTLQLESREKERGAEEVQLEAALASLHSLQRKAADLEAKLDVSKARIAELQETTPRKQEDEYDDRPKKRQAGERFVTKPNGERLVKCSGCKRLRLLPPHVPFPGGERWVCSQYDYVPGSKLNNCNVPVEHLNTIVRNICYLKITRPPSAAGVEIPEDGQKALLVAATAGDLALVKHLLDVELVDLKHEDPEGNGVFHKAVCANRLELVKYLVEVKGVDVNRKNWEGCDGLHLAAIHGHLDIIMYLTSRRMDLRRKTKKGEWSVIHWAASGGHLHVMKYLVEVAGMGLADLEDTDQENKTALHWAVDKGHLELVKYLVKKGMDVNATTKGGRNALHWAVRHVPVIDYLVDEQHMDLYAGDRDGLTVLHWAAYFGILDVVQYLVEARKMDTHTETNAGDTAHRLAWKQGRIQVCEYLSQLRR
eukprot:jgi/Mesvir1/11946/Mv25015-RA.1